MRPTRTCLAFAGALLATAPIALSSQPIYRCGNNYGQTPCANGIVVHAEDLRTPDQKAQTDAATLQAARMAARMERDRLASQVNPAHAIDRPPTARPAKRSTTSQSATRQSGSEVKRPTAQPKAKTRSRPQPPAPDHFVATARQDDRKKPVTAPTRD